MWNHIKLVRLVGWNLLHSELFIEGKNIDNVDKTALMRMHNFFES